MDTRRYARARSLCHARRRVQVNWLGYLGTLGAPWYDYVLTDRFVVPPAQQPVLQRAGALICPTATARATPAGRWPRARPTAPPAACPPKGFVFCCFNNSYKILPELFDCLDAAAAPRCRAACSGSLRATPPPASICAAKRRRAGSSRRGCLRAAGEPAPSTWRAMRTPTCSSTPCPITRAPPPTMRCSWACRC